MTGRVVSLFLVAAIVGGCTTGGAPAARTSRERAVTRLAGETGPVREIQAVAPRPSILPLPRGETFVAIPTEPRLPMWDAPGATSHPAFEYDARNPLGRVSPLLVSHAARRVGEDWFQVYLPLRPNGSTAWVRARDIRLRRATEHLEVDVSKRTMWRYDGDRVVDRFRVGVGTDATPTATGTFFVWVKVHYADGASPYGPMALGLSGFSRVLSYWRGGGRMAIHGTADPSDRGHAVSNGCVRVYDPDLRRLADVPLGTPVVIHA